MNYDQIHKLFKSNRTSHAISLIFKSAAKTINRTRHSPEFKEEWISEFGVALVANKRKLIHCDTVTELKRWVIALLYGAKQKYQNQLNEGRLDADVDLIDIAQSENDAYEYLMSKLDNIVLSEPDRSLVRGLIGLSNDGSEPTVANLAKRIRVSSKALYARIRRLRQRLK